MVIGACVTVTLAVRRRRMKNLAEIDITRAQCYKTFFTLFFMQSAFNLSNGVTDTLASSTILIYLIHVRGIYLYTRGRVDENKKLIKRNGKERHYCKFD
jgi:hypothetical protein